VDNFPGNQKHRNVPVTEKKIERVVSGSVSRRRKPLGKRVTELLIAGNSQTVSQYVLLDVLLPAAKDMITDAITGGVERLVYGEGRVTSRRGGVTSRPAAGGYISYNNRYTGNRVGGPPQDSRPAMSQQARTLHNFDEIVLESRYEAEDVITKLRDTIARYEATTVADLYDMVGEARNYTDEKWGWKDLTDASASRVHGGYVLNLPRPIPID
jgi:hypothetical protein